MVSFINSHTNATRIRWHLWKIDLRFAPGLSLGWSGGRIAGCGADREEPADAHRLPLGQGDHRWQAVEIRAASIVQHPVQTSAATNEAGSRIPPVVPAIFEGGAGPGTEPGQQSSQEGAKR